MSCYFSAQIRIDDSREYSKYLEKVEGLAASYGGKYLAVDTAPVVVEGEWPYTRAVIIEFPDEASLRRWYYSPEYQGALKHRLAAGRSDSVIVHGEE